MMYCHPYFSLDTSDPHSLLDAILHSPCMPHRCPDALAIDDRPVMPIPDNWREIASKPRRATRAKWVRDNVVVSSSVRLRTLLLPWTHAEPFAQVPLKEIIAMLRKGPDMYGFALDFEGYSEYQFGNHKIGWCLVLKGKCVETNLLSPRILDYGPWLVRTYDDLVVVFFHELDVDLATKAAQARAAQAGMFGPEGSFVGGFPVYDLPPGATYVPAERRLEVPVYGRQVPPLEMVYARWIVLNQGLGPSRPLERVTYSFADPAEVGPHLHQMWLRGIEVVTFIDGYRTVLTDHYDPPPPPPPPEWVERLRARLEAEGL